MGEFVCKVADPAGHVFEQIETAQSEEEARNKLTDRGLFIYGVRRRRALSFDGLFQRRDRAVRGNDFLIFNQQFNTLIKAGLPILKALDLLADRTAAPRLRPVLSDVRQQVRDGALLSEAIEAQGIFPPVYTSTVLAGEKSGDLAGGPGQAVCSEAAWLWTGRTGRRRRLAGARLRFRAAAWLAVPERNAAERQIARHLEGASMEEIFAEQVRWGERVTG